MADFFKDGQLDYIQRLNQMYTSFAAGPYNALPLSGGVLTGKLTASAGLSTTAMEADVTATSSMRGKLVLQTTSTPGWYKIGRLLGGVPAAGRIFVGGTSGYGAGGATGSSAGLTEIHFRAENDGLLRGFIYCTSSGFSGVFACIIDGNKDVYLSLGTSFNGDVQVYGEFGFTPGLVFIGATAPAGQAMLAKKVTMLGTLPALTVDSVGLATPGKVAAIGDVTSGNYLRGSLISVGPIAAGVGQSVISGIDQSQGATNLALPNSATFYVCAGPVGAAAATAVNISRNTSTGRSMNAGGTINASGADYAEYMTKAALCGAIAPGQIVGIDAEGRLTDKWDFAIAFSVKSTNPCMVGGDSWAQHLGQRPAAPLRVQPTVEQVLVTPAVSADEASGTDAIPAVYDTVTNAPGDTDDEWAAKQAVHVAAQAAFDIALEAARQTVDRIAFAGQVPLNVFGATPGQFIVPVQEGEGIAGMAMDKGEMNLDQYVDAIGRVIAIEEDGRARIIVKVA
jgi:hypothetical protein